MKKGSKLFELKITQTAILGSAALILSAFQMLLPDLPIAFTGAKPGFSNIIVALACEVLGFSSAISIVLIKAIFAFAIRGASAFLMSISGGLLSCFIMYCLIKCNISPFGYLGIGIMGALFHNGAQLLVAYLLTGEAIFYYVPALLLISLLTGSITGISMGILIPAAKRSLQKANFEKI